MGRRWRDVRPLAVSTRINFDRNFSSIAPDRLIRAVNYRYLQRPGSSLPLCSRPLKAVIHILFSNENVARSSSVEWNFSRRPQWPVSVENAPWILPSSCVLSGGFTHRNSDHGHFSLETDRPRFHFFRFKVPGTKLPIYWPAGTHFHGDARFPHDACPPSDATSLKHFQLETSLFPIF